MHCLNSEHCSFGGGGSSGLCSCDIFRQRYFSILKGVQKTNGSKKSFYLELRIIRNRL